MRLLIVILMIAFAASVQSAVVWDRANFADENTLALYHFDEGSGTAAGDSGTHGFNGTLTSDFHAYESSGHWLSSGAGTYLSANAGSPGDYMNTVAISGADMNLGLTISFWYRIRDEVGSPAGGTLARLRYLGTALDFFIATDTFGTGNNGRLNARVIHPDPDLESGLVSYGADHIWRHLALTYDPDGDASDGGTWQFYMDNVAVGSAMNDTIDLSSVTSFDFRFMSDLFGTQGSSADFDELLIQNGIIEDFSGGAGSVPEPGALSLLVLGGLFTSLFRTRRRSQQNIGRWVRIIR